MKKRFKLVLYQAMFINFLMTLFIGIIDLVYYLIGQSTAVSYFRLLSCVLISVLTALCSFVFDLNIFKKLNSIVQIAIHYLLLASIITGALFLFNWGDGVIGIMITYIVFTVIYVLVWVFTLRIRIKDDEEMNSILKNNKED